VRLQREADGGRWRRRRETREGIFITYIHEHVARLLAKKLDRRGGRLGWIMGRSKKFAFCIRMRACRQLFLRFSIVFLRDADADADAGENDPRTHVTPFYPQRGKSDSVRCGAVRY
jgi:hypothetical protein